MPKRRYRDTIADRAEFALMVRGTSQLALVREIARLREALDDIAMGANRRVAFEALKDEHSHVPQHPRACA